MRIRSAGVEDAAALARVQVASWRETYRGILPDTTLDRLSVAERADLWRRVLSGGGWALLLRDPGGAAAGFIGGGASRDRDARPGDGEIYAIHVLEAWQGRGLGRRLVQAAVRRLEADGLTALTVWTPEKNRGGRAFYDRLGGRIDRVEDEIVDGRRVQEVRYRWRGFPVV